MSERYDPVTTRQDAIASTIESYEAEIDRLRALNAELVEALEQCREYLRHSLGSTSEINPFPAMEAALAKAEGREP